MSDIAKLPKWAREMIAEKDRELRDLRESVATLRGERIIEDQVGEFLQNGYREEVLSVGRYFRLRVGTLEVHMRDGELAISVENGVPAVIPWVSNMITIRNLPTT